MKKVENGVKVKEISTLKDLKDLVTELSNNTLLSDKSIIGITENGDFCVSPVAKNDDLSYNNTTASDFDDNSNYNFDKTDYKHTNYVDDYYGLIRRDLYNINNSNLMDELNTNRTINDETSRSIIKAKKDINNKKKEIINEALNKIFSIDDFATKAIIDTILERSSIADINSKKDMIKLINKGDIYDGN